MHAGLTDAGWALLRASTESVAREYLFRDPVEAVECFLVWLTLLFVAAWRAGRGRIAREACDTVGAPSLDSARHECVIPCVMACVIVGVLATLSAAASGLIAKGILGGRPHLQDEIGYTFTARTMASGRLVAPAPPAPMARAFVQPGTMVLGDGWVGKYAPGWPAVLALGVVAGVPWLVNPLLDALAILLLFDLLSRWVGPRRALLGTALLAASPFFIVMGASRLSHPLTLVLHLCLLLALERARADGLLASGTLRMGIAAGALFLVRPQEAPMLLLAPAVWVMGLGGPGTRERLAVAWRLAAPVMGALAITALYDRTVSGEWHLSLLPVYSVFDRPGFGQDVGIGRAYGHNVFQAVLNAAMNLLVLNEDLFGWPGLSLSLTVIALVALRRFSPVERLAVASSASIAALYSCYFSQGIAYGARYAHALLPFMVLLTLGGLDEVERRLGPPGRSATRATLLVLCAVALVTWWPARLAGLHNYWGTLSHPVVPGPAPTAGDIVVIPRISVGSTHLYASYFSLNPIDLGADSPLYIEEGPWCAGGQASRLLGGRRLRPLDPRAGPLDHGGAPLTR